MSSAKARLKSIVTRITITLTSRPNCFSVIKLQSTAISRSVAWTSNYQAIEVQSFRVIGLNRSGQIFNWFFIDFRLQITCNSISSIRSNHWQRKRLESLLDRHLGIESRRIRGLKFIDAYWHLWVGIYELEFVNWWSMSGGLIQQTIGVTPSKVFTIPHDFLKFNSLDSNSIPKPVPYCELLQELL